MPGSLSGEYFTSNAKMTASSRTIDTVASGRPGSTDDMSDTATDGATGAVPAVAAAGMRTGAGAFAPRLPNVAVPTTGFSVIAENLAARGFGSVKGYGE